METTITKTKIPENPRCVRSIQTHILPEHKGDDIAWIRPTHRKHASTNSTVQLPAFYDGNQSDVQKGQDVVYKKAGVCENSVSPHGQRRGCRDVNNQNQRSRIWETI